LNDAKDTNTDLAFRRSFKDKYLYLQSQLHPHPCRPAAADYFNDVADREMSTGAPIALAYYQH